MNHKKLIIVIALIVGHTLFAQTPTDGFQMYRGEWCTFIGYQHSSWTKYWEGQRFKENLNIGTFTSQAVMPMMGFGVSHKINVFAGLPYIKNESNKGTMMGMKGWQDALLAIKWVALEKNNKDSSVSFKTYLTSQFTTPVTAYKADFLPYSIGLGATTLQLSATTHLVIRNDYFATAYFGYTMKSNIKVDRQAYYNGDKVVYSNRMPVSDMVHLGLRMGVDKARFRADVHYLANLCTTGADIRRNDMPYPFYKMNAHQIGVYGLLWIPKVEGLGLNASCDQIIAGRNVGKATTFTLGIQYVFNITHLF